MELKHQIIPSPKTKQNKNNEQNVWNNVFFKTLDNSQKWSLRSREQMSWALWLSWVRPWKNFQAMAQGKETRQNLVDSSSEEDKARNSEKLSHVHD